MTATTPAAKARPTPQPKARQPFVRPRNFPANADLRRVIAAAEALSDALRDYLHRHPDGRCRCGRCKDGCLNVSDVAAAVLFQSDLVAGLFGGVVWPALDDPAADPALGD